ncbi:hypothetical protein PIB30_006286 [Stylosanthes scabra]|uniref:Uncharacterized protein n=1 Tax=Stylosanthes scabra TaxID=79078 RepID=A0ABU6Q597_9FABA|nr:hypothetical protein [Stylosanthes scabra]
MATCQKYILEEGVGSECVTRKMELLLAALVDGLLSHATSHANPVGISGTTHPCPINDREHASRLYSKAATECAAKLQAA